MNRLQKKCFVASAGFHGLLGVILFVGPAFLSSRQKPEDLPVLNFVPLKTVDELISGGGNPKAKDAPLPAAPQPVPPPKLETPVQPPELKPVVQQPKAEPPKKIREPEPPKPIKSEEPLFESSKTSHARRIEISTNLITRHKDLLADSRKAEEAQARREARAALEARRQLAKQLGQAADEIQSELSGGTSVEFRGPGGGGVPYANWRQAVKSAFADAWLLPDGVVDTHATTETTVVIAKDGQVLDSRITGLSGDATVDRSVQAALDRVHKVPPLPENAKEDQRTVKIKFNVRDKLGSG